jgi:ACS family tartrate transporter-like MFS transporter
MRRVSWRLRPFLIFAYLLCYIDRVNVGFASLQMNKAVGIDPRTYGLGAGIFFIGYFILEVPSNLGLERFMLDVDEAGFFVGVILCLTY